MRSLVGTEPVEDKERIEVLNGASGFLYGFTSPGGMINYALKRPTATRLNRVTVGDYGGEQAYAHVDLGGPVDEAGRVGYRLNALKVARGDTGVDNQTHKRELVSGAVDVHLAPDTLWSLDASHFDRDIERPQAIFRLGNATSVPNAPDLTNNYGGASYTFTHDEYDRVGTGLNSRLAEGVTLRAAMRYTTSENASLNMRNIFVGNNGDYTFQLQAKGTSQTNTTQGYGFLDWEFRTPGLSHKATTGITHDYNVSRATYPNNDTSTYTISGASSSISNYSYPDDPYYALHQGGTMRDSEEWQMSSAIIADRVEINDQWSVLAGATLAKIDDTSWTVNTGAISSSYTKQALTPAGALMFKPIPAVTTYASYVQALEKGSVAGTSYANAGEALSPYVSDQYEVGAKSTFGRMDVNLALFRIEKQAEYVTDANTLTADGEQVHQGVELNFMGKLTDQITLGGGVTWLDATITKTSTANVEGKTPIGVPDYIATLYGEYALPQLSGLSLLAGASYTGQEWVNSTNTVKIPEVFLLDAGARYQTEIYGTPSTFRLNVTNLLGARYWTNKGDNMLYPGNPRTVMFSVSADF